MRLTVPARVAAPLAGALILLASIPFAPSILSPGLGLYFTIGPSADNGSVRVAPVSTMWIPRVVVGPLSQNGSPVVYVLGVNAANNTGNTSCARPANTSCAPLTVVRSDDGGRSFAPPQTTDTHVPGWGVDAIALPNGTLVAASWGPWILVSSDGGSTWNVTAVLGEAVAPASLARDTATGVLYAVWPTKRSWAFVQGSFLMSSSRDGGYTWESPIEILPESPGGLSPVVAAYNDHVVVAMNYGITPNYIGVMDSTDGGLTWSAVTDLSAPNISYEAPSVAVSPEGTFAVTWGQLGEDGSILVALSRDYGSTWASPTVVANLPGGGFGHSAAFDNRSRLYITWISDAPYVAPATLYVAASDRSLERFNSASFSVTLQTNLRTDLWYQSNLGAGPTGSVFLAWESADNSAQNDSVNGIYVRPVSGGVRGLVSPHNLPPEQSMIIELLDRSTGMIIREATWSGGEVEFGGLAPDNYAIRVETDNTSFDYGPLPVQPWSLTSFTLGVGPPAVLAEMVWTAVAAVVAAVLFFATGLSALQYTRLVKEDILQRRVRGLIFDYVHKNPGSSFSAIRDALGLQNGVAAYHLAVLENQGLLHSKIHRRHRWYYPEGDISTWRDLPLSPLQAAILDVVQGSPGVGVREIARKTGHRVSSVAYNIKGLAREGALREERSGRLVRYFALRESGSG